MKLKRYLDFLKESNSMNSIWSDRQEIIDIFQFIIDEEYKVFLDNLFLGYYGWSEDQYFETSRNPEPGEEPKIFFKEDVLEVGETYKPGFRILIQKSNRSKGDFTDEFQNCIKHIKSMGYKIKLIQDDEDAANIDMIHFVDGSIITWVPEIPNKPLTTNPEDWADGDIYVSTAELTIIIYQDEEVKITESDLAQFYDWKCDKIVGERIYCHVDIDDMARYLLSSRSYKEWGNILNNGTDMLDYYWDGYVQDFSSVIWYLDAETLKSFVRVMIRELGGIENLGEFIKTEVKTEDEAINVILSDKSRDIIEKMSKDSEVYTDIRQTVQDWERQAHCDKNQKELEEAFDRVIDREGIEYTKIWKEVVKSYRTKEGERKEYTEDVQHYELPFDQKWISDYGKTLKGYSLTSVFCEWAQDVNFDNTLNPHFSDWGDVNRVDLNSEIAANLKWKLNKSN